MTAPGRSVREAEHLMKVQAGFAVVARRDVADRAQHLALRG
jgi:hypothetical protein